LVEDVVMLPMLVLNLMSWWNIILVARKNCADLSINFLLGHHRMVWKHGVNKNWRRRTDVSVSNSSQTIINFLTLLKTRNRSLDRTKRTVSIQKRDSMENRNTKRELSCWKINPCYGSTPKYGKWCRLMVTQL
jgi:hypothetical protein